MNSKRILIGALAGGVAWTIWSMIVNMGILGSTYMAEGSAGHVLIQPRYGLAVFMITWIVIFFFFRYRGLSVCRSAYELGAGTQDCT